MKAKSYTQLSAVKCKGPNIAALALFPVSHASHVMPLPDYQCVYLHISYTQSLLLRGYIFVCVCVCKIYVSLTLSLKTEKEHIAFASLILDYLNIFSLDPCISLQILLFYYIYSSVILPEQFSTIECTNFIVMI